MTVVGWLLFKLPDPVETSWHASSLPFSTRASSQRAILLVFALQPVKITSTAWMH